jgi:hypothetical protein
MRKVTLVVVLSLILFASAWAVAAQMGGPYDLSWNTVDSGGDTFSSGGPFSLGGTVGQPDAGTMSGGAYTLEGGFWPSAGPAGGLDRYTLYVPAVRR